MANNDALWFDLGVRDSVTNVLDQLINKANALGRAFEAATQEIGKDASYKNAYKNAEELERVIDKIAVTINRVGEAQNRASDSSSAKLSEVKGKLEDMLAVFKKIKEEAMTNDGLALMVKDKDIVAVAELMEGTKLAITQAERYAKTAEQVTKVNDKMFEKALNDLNAFNESWGKMNSGESRQAQLVREMKEQIALEKSIKEEAQNGQSQFNFESWKRAEEERWRTRAKESAAVFQKEFENEEKVNQIIRERQEMETHRRERQQIKEDAENAEAAEQVNKELKARAQLNKMLDQNTASYNAMKKILLDAESEQKVAVIRRKKAEYNALATKIREISRLMSEIANERTGIENGTVKTPTLTKEKVQERLYEIERKYNEELAEQQVKEQQVAEAKKRSADASKKQAEATRQAEQAIRSQNEANRGLLTTFGELERAGRRTNKMLDQMGQSLATYFSFYGIKHFTSQIITIGGQFEFQHKAIQNILGDMQEANLLFAQLQDLAVESPKTFMELTSYAKQLSAYQIPSEELYDTTKRLADLSTGLGVDMSRLILAYGQVRSAAVLRGQELRQFTEAGIPMVQALANKFTEMNGKLVTTADVFKLISQRAVPFKMVQEVLWDMTNQGGQFYNMQEELADTLYGKWQKLQDTWQIMLGRMADSTSPLGWTLRNLIELIVTLTKGLDNAVPLISAIALSRGRKALLPKYESFVQNVVNSSDENAISTMRLAKEKEANKLMQERIKNGRILTAQEWELIRTKDQVTLNDKLQLAFADKISNKMLAKSMYAERNAFLDERMTLLAKGHTIEEVKQLQLEKERNILLSYRYLLMKGYTKEQIRQMRLGEFSMLQDGRKGLKELFTSGGIMGVLKGGGGQLLGGLKTFLGGWPGLVITAGGAIMSLVDMFKEGSRELETRAESMMSHAQKASNELSTTLGQIENSGDTTYRKIEVLENALISMGVEGKRIVEDSRGFEDLEKRFSSLTEQAKAYKEVLESMGTNEGKTLYKQMLEDSDIEDEVDEFNDLKDAEIRLIKPLNKFSSKYTKMIDDLKRKHKELNNELTSTNVFENLRTLLTGKYANEAIGYYAGNARDALTEYYNAIKDTEDKLNDIDEKAIPKMSESVRLEITKAGVDLTKSFNELSEKEKEIIRAAVTEAARGVKGASDDTINHIADRLAQGFYTELRVKLVTNTQYTGFAEQLNLWQERNGVKLWGESDLQEANSDPLQFSLNNSKRRKEWKDQEKRLNKEIANARRKNKPQVVEQYERQLKSIEERLSANIQSENEGYWAYTDPSKRNGGSKKADEQLKMARTRLEEVKSFMSEYKKYRETYGDDKAVSLLEQLFPTTAGRGQQIVSNYKGVLNNILKDLGALTTDDRKKFGLSINKLMAEYDLDKDKRVIDTALKELQEYINKQTSQWNLYKSLFGKTGNKDFAMNAFSNARIFDDVARELEKKLQEVSGGKGINYDMTQTAAEKFYEGNKQAYELWKKIVEITSHNYTDALNKGADAMAAQLSVAEKILKIDKEIAELQAQGNVPGNAQRIFAKQKEKEKLSYDQFQQDAEYVKFFGSVVTMTRDELETTANVIKNRLITELTRGNITAHQYTKSLKEVNEQLSKGRTVLRGATGAFLSGGQKGLADFRDQQVANAAVDYELARKKTEELEKQLAQANELGSADFNRIQLELMGAQKAEEEAKARLEAAAKALGISVEQLQTLETMKLVVDSVKAVFDGLQKAATNLANMYEALGKTQAANKWSDIADTISAISSPLTPVSNVLQNAMSGNLPGLISSAISAPVDLFTAPITAFAKLHDKKIQREIEASQQRQKEMQYLTGRLEAVLAKTLGGVYKFSSSKLGKLYRDRFSALADEQSNTDYVSSDTKNAYDNAKKTQEYYDMMRAQMMGQRDELQHQMDMERDKKNADQNAINDYSNQIRELEDQLVTFAEDMAKALYDIDVKSWASQLGNALYEAWQNGEKGAEAFKKKASEIIGQVSRNILVTKMLETAMEPVSRIIAEMMDKTSGKLDPITFATNVADAFDSVLNSVTPGFEQVMNAVENVLEKHGMSAKDSNKSSSTSGAIKNITESTADLLASYINAIRADVSVNRYTLQQILDAVQNNRQLPVLAEAQLNELRTLVSLARTRTGFVEEIRDILHRVTPDGDKIRVS